MHATLLSVVLVDQFGSDRLYNTFGIVLLFDGIASTIGPPLTSEYIQWNALHYSRTNPTLHSDRFADGLRQNIPKQYLAVRGVDHILWNMLSVDATSQNALGKAAHQQRNGLRQKWLG